MRQRPFISVIFSESMRSSKLINQSLFYLSWIQDHRGDFEIVAQKSLGNKVEVDWSDIRVICIAPNYKKYDLHAVNVMGANLELWTYRLFKNGVLYLEQEVFDKSTTTSSSVSVAGTGLTAGQKAAISRKTDSYTIDQHFKGKSSPVKELAQSVQEFFPDLDPAIDEVPKKDYIAYKISKNFVCMKIQKHQVRLYVKLDPKKVDVPSNLARDVTNIGHFGTGDLALTIKSQDDLEQVKPQLEQAYQKVSG